MLENRSTVLKSKYLFAKQIDGLCHQHFDISSSYQFIRIKLALWCGVKITCSINVIPNCICNATTAITNSLDLDRSSRGYHEFLWFMLNHKCLRNGCPIYQNLNIVSILCCIIPLVGFSPFHVVE